MFGLKVSDKIDRKICGALSPHDAHHWTAERMDDVPVFLYKDPHGHSVLVRASQ